MLNIGHKNLCIFSKQALAARIRESDATADDWLPAFLHTAYEPTSTDFRRLKNDVATHRRTYEANYLPLRHGVFAHRGVMNRAELYALLENTNIHELGLLLEFLADLHEALWRLFYCGHKPTLPPAGFSGKEMREQPSLQRKKHEQQLIDETERLLKSLSNCTDNK